MKEQGILAEQQAANFLETQGLLILQRNFRVPLGEIDIIAKDDTTLVFVEVRARRCFNFGSPAETITWRKQQRIILTAQSFIQRHPGLASVACRFDVIEIKLNNKSNSIHWIQDAFTGI